MQRRHLLAGAAGAALGLASTSAARAQGVGGNVTRICNGFPPGSSADALSRVLANKLTTPSANFIVENRTGAGGRIAVDYVKNAAPDGQTLLVTPDAIMMLYPSVYKSLTYDPVHDFQSITTLGSVPLTFCVGPLVPTDVQTMGDFAKWAKANPSQSSFGTSGAGTTLHFTGVMFARDAGFALTHVPYRGANLAAQDVAAGQLAACVAVLSDVLALAQGGKLRVLGVSSEKRSRFLPGAATFREQGLKSIEWTTWYGFFAPAKTPEARVASLYARSVETMTQPDAAEALAKFGMEPATSPPGQLGVILKRDIERWAAVVKQVGYTAVD